MNSDMTAPREIRESIEQLLGDVCGLADDVVQRITDAKVDAQLQQLLAKVGYDSQPQAALEPAVVQDAVFRREILVAAQRALAIRAAAEEGLPAA